MKISLFISALVVFGSCLDKSHESNNAEHSDTFDQKTHLVDTSFISTIRLNDITVCSSTVSDVNQLGYSPVLTPKQNIDPLVISESWEDGDYYYDKEKNLLFCTFNNTELLSSIFLKDKFTGTLRGLPIADFSKLSVREITSFFRDLHWSTTDVSDYWIYGNDTINFYIKIDTSIPRFPLNEKFYQDKSPVLAKIQLSCYEIYGAKYAKNDTVTQKPLYAPLNDTHLNYYLLKRRSGLETTIKEIISTGKESNIDEIRIGKWLTYNPDHSIKSTEYYKDGKVVSVDRQ